MDPTLILYCGLPVVTTGFALWATTTYLSVRLERVGRSSDECLARICKVQAMTEFLVRRHERQRDMDALLDVFRLTDEQADNALAAYRGPDPAPKSGRKIGL